MSDTEDVKGYSLSWYKARINEANAWTNAILTEYENDCPNPELLEVELASEVYKIPFLEAKYRRRRKAVEEELIKAQRFHARITVLAKDYYGAKERHDVADYEKFGWTSMCDISITPQERQVWIDADPVYQSVTVWMATQQKNLELINENIKSLVERGRQLKTAMEFIRFKNGGV